MLLDTSGLLLFFDPKSRRHAEAARIFHLTRPRFAHLYVIAEFVALATSRGFHRPAIVAFARHLAGPVVEITYVDQTLHESALNLLSRRLDKEWSLCDAVSFLLMDARNENEAFTTDHHFEQAGFRRLLTS